MGWCSASILEKKGIMVKSDINSKVLKELAPIKREKGVYMFVSAPENYKPVSRAILYNLLKWKWKGIYITLNTPYKQLLVDLKSHGIDISRLYFIDGISKTGGKIINSDNCTFLEGPQSLTELSIAITTACNTKSFDFLFFDSLSTITMYNDLKTSEKFSQYIINKLRNLDINAIIISLNEKGSLEVINVVSQFCNKCVHF